MRAARAVGAAGRTMIAGGVLILLFVVYQLWGTGLHTWRAQGDAEDQFQDALDEAGVDDLPDVTEDVAPVPDQAEQVIPDAPPHGELVGLIQIPAIGVEKYVFEGVDPDVLQMGPGHYEGSPLPGEEGNAAIAGHRTTYGAPFNRLDELGEGDRIVFTYGNGSRFVYRYLNTVHVTESGVEVLEPKFDDRLTLTSCHPKYSAAQRIVVSAELLGHHAPPAVRTEESAAPSPTGRLGPPDQSVDGVDHARTPAVVWGLAAAMVWLTAWVLGRAWKRWPTYAVALPIFLVMLYGFFENFAYLLPASY
jgi:sortase A